MLRHITFTVFITTSMNTLATGMVPETSVLLVDEKRGEASINIKNTDDHPSLLYTTIVDLPESNKSIRLIPTQPVIRVEAGQVQQVRFLLQATVPLQSEELKRVTFEGIPPKDDKSSRVTVSIRQDRSAKLSLLKFTSRFPKARPKRRLTAACRAATHTASGNARYTTTSRTG